MASSEIRVRLVVDSEALERAILRVEARFLEEIVDEYDEWTVVGQEARERLQSVRDRLAVLSLVAGS